MFTVQGYSDGKFYSLEVGVEPNGLGLPVRGSNRAIAVVHLHHGTTITLGADEVTIDSHTPLGVLQALTKYTQIVSVAGTDIPNLQPIEYAEGVVR